MSVPNIPYINKRLHTPFEESYALKIIGGIKMKAYTKECELLIEKRSEWIDDYNFGQRFELNKGEDKVIIFTHAWSMFGGCSPEPVSVKEMTSESFLEKYAHHYEGVY